MDYTALLQTSESLLGDPLLNPPNDQVTNYNSLLLKVEAISSRLNVVETQLGLAKPLKPVSSIPEVENLLNSIDVNISDIEGYLASPHLIFKDDKRKKSKYLCPAENCDRWYVRIGELHRHIRTANGRGHQLLNSIVGQQQCPYCSKKTKAILRHEHSAHGIQLISRLDKLLPHFGIFSPSRIRPPPDKPFTYPENLDTGVLIPGDGPMINNESLDRSSTISQTPQNQQQSLQAPPDRNTQPPNAAPLYEVAPVFRNDDLPVDYGSLQGDVTHLHNQPLYEVAPVFRSDESTLAVVFQDYNGRVYTSSTGG